MEDKLSFTAKGPDALISMLPCLFSKRLSSINDASKHQNVVLNRAPPTSRKVAIDAKRRLASFVGLRLLHAPRVP